MNASLDRRAFLKATSAAGIGVLGHMAVPGRLAARNDTVVAAVMGVNSRGRALAQSFARADGCEVKTICDVDPRAISAAVQAVSDVSDSRPEGVEDIRRVLDDDDIDALVIAAPDHWHAPAAIMALQAGKHVYVEKPCGHNPREGELLVAAQKRYGRVVQMGNQQRASQETQQIIQAIREGLIGRAYYGRAWYANTRGSIGKGKQAAVPEWLNYDLWQGPAPRRPYRDNLIHYNWHWFWHWGTGEICNNGTHEIDICRWALGVDFPSRVTSAGGRYHFDDDWEFYDTQVASFEFEDNKMFTWDGRSCNGRSVEGLGRGASIHGEAGSVVLDRQGYVVYDQNNKEVWKRTRSTTVSTLDTVGGGGLTDEHIANFIGVIREGGEQFSPIDEGHKSTLLCHLGNIAQQTGRALQCDPVDGRILNDEEAMQLWSRSYEPGWEVEV